jgi:cell division transport system permease protein
MALKGKSTFRRGLFRQPIQSAEKLSDRVKAHWNLQSDSLRESFRRMWQTPIASTLTILVVAIALALPASFNALIQNARQPIEALESTSQISLFLKPELSNEAGRKLALKLNKHPVLAGATLITKEDGLKELAAYSGFGDALAALNSNPLPAVIIAHPVKTDADAVTRLLAELKTLPEADRVQFDSEWLEKLRALLAIAGRCAAAFSVLLGFGVLFIVGNTIRLELQNRREEIAVAKMLGATHRFIRRPFVHAGLWYALLGAILAWLLANLLILGVRSPANQLAELYGSPFRLSYLGLADTAILLASAVLLGIIGAWVVVAHFLREIDPD